MREETNKKLKNIKPIRKGKSLIQAKVEFHSSKTNLRWKTLKEREQMKIKSVNMLL